MEYVIICLLFLVILFFSVLYYIYRRTFYVPRVDDNFHYDLSFIRASDEKKEEMLGMIRELAAIPYERVSIRSHDGLLLSARYYHVCDGAPVQIQCHGYRGSALRDFSGGARLARALGHNVLLIDQRAAAPSEGRTTTFGILEHQDVLGWVEYVNVRFCAPPIFLVGISMGAATVLMCRSCPLPENVVGIIADCPYDTPSHIIAKIVGEIGLPVRPTMVLIRMSARIFGHFDLCAHDPLRAVTEGDVPVLLLHGEGDTFVPCSMSDSIARVAKGDFTYVSFPEAEHGLSFCTDPDRYRHTIQTFISRTLPKGEGYFV